MPNDIDRAKVNIKMNNTRVIQRDKAVDDSVLNFIIDNMPNGGYATVATKLGYSDRRTVRDEVIMRKKLYNAEIINTCLEIIEFVTAKTMQVA
jgi:hypothetical protein